MVPPARSRFDRADAEPARTFSADVLGIPSHRVLDGMTVLAFAPGQLGVHPRALSHTERLVLGPDGLALTCEDLPDMIAEKAIEKFGVDRMEVLHECIDTVRRGGTISISGV